MDRYMSNYRQLGSAIILQAVDDYRAARQAFMNCPKDYKAKAVMQECENFFLSDRFTVFTNLDGKALLENLRKEVE